MLALISLVGATLTLRAHTAATQPWVKTQRPDRLDCARSPWSSWLERDLLDNCVS
jgi:hypothetical protein